MLLELKLTRSERSDECASPSKNTTAADYGWDLELFVTVRGADVLRIRRSCPRSAARSCERLSLHYAAAPLGKDKKTHLHLSPPNCRVFLIKSGLGETGQTFAKNVKARAAFWERRGERGFNQKDGFFCFQFWRKKVLVRRVTVTFCQNRALKQVHCKKWFLNQII